jgi:hypothetical protein
MRRNTQRMIPPKNRTIGLRGARVRERARRGVLLALRAGLAGALRVRFGATSGGFLGPVVLMLALPGLVCLGHFIVRDHKSRDPVNTDRDF